MRGNLARSSISPRSKKDNDRGACAVGDAFRGAVQLGAALSSRFGSVVLSTGFPQMRPRAAVEKGSAWDNPSCTSRSSITSPADNGLVVGHFKDPEGNLIGLASLNSDPA
jgi:hypothetical protein